MFFTMLTMFKKLSNMAPPSLTRGPCLDADFCLSQTRAGTQRPTQVISQGFESDLLFIHFLSQFLKIFFLDQNMQKEDKWRKAEHFICIVYQTSKINLHRKPPPLL